MAWTGTRADCWSVSADALVEFAIKNPFLRHARPCAGHPHLYPGSKKDVDGRDKPGHDESVARLPSQRNLGSQAVPAAQNHR
jgi:hypothetical protein